MDVILNGKNIRLRKIVRSDAVAITRYAKDPAISRFTLIPRPYTMESSYRFIRHTHLMRRRGMDQSLGIELKERGEIIGMISLMHIDRKNRNAEIGYWLAKPYWRRGYSLEAIRLIIKYGFRKLKLVRIYARVLHPNLASAKLLEKAGFRYEGRFRKSALMRGRWMDDLLYGMLKEECL